MLVAIHRSKLTEYVDYGVIVAESKTLLLIQREIDFVFDGYAVLRRSDVTAIRRSSGRDFQQAFMRKEKTWRVPAPAIRRLPLESFSTLAMALTGKFVTLENERNEDFWIGPIVDVAMDKVFLRWFSPDGKWGDVEKVRCRDITELQFGTRYLETYRRHLPRRPRWKG